MKLNQSSKVIYNQTNHDWKDYNTRQQMQYTTSLYFLIDQNWTQMKYILECCMTYVPKNDSNHQRE